MWVAVQDTAVYDQGQESTSRFAQQWEERAFPEAPVENFPVGIEASKKICKTNKTVCNIR